MPAQRYTLTVSANGSGLYQLNNDVLAQDQEYIQTVELTSAAQTYDVSATEAGSTALDTSAPGTAYSSTRIPPLERVEHVTGGGCAPVTSSGPVTKYAFDFYILHVDVGEVPPGYIVLNQEGFDAFTALAQNFGWYHRRYLDHLTLTIPQTTSALSRTIHIPSGGHAYTDRISGAGG